MKKALLTMMCLATMMMASMSLKAQEVTIVLMPGWTWISIPSTDTLDFATALGSFTPMAGDIIKSQWGNASYRADGQWRGSISQFYPGYGYMYKSTRTMPVMLTFNAQQPSPQVVVTTSEPMLITAISAMGGGEVTANDGTYIIVKGLCWATHENPTTNDDFFQEAESGVGSFAISMTNLNMGTAYYVRAYAVTPNGTVYGDQKTFTTQDGIPSLTTADVTNITGESAICGGDITDNGGLNITERGVCWSISPNPTIADSHTADSSGIGNFSSSITGLSMNTTYYVRAYATNSNTTAYGNEVSFITLSIPTGALNGLFTINANGDQVYFSQGNLQYQASTNTWRFAEHQWNYVGTQTPDFEGYVGGNVEGSDNANISSTYSGWIDLFGWGTSGYNHGAICYQPWSISDSGYEYSAYNSHTANLYDQSGQADWGYNAISNGGNTINTWRTLSFNEFEYILTHRNTLSGERYAKAQVNGVYGTILLPDNWNSTIYELNNTNTYNADFSTNIISETDWQVLEEAGAVLLPITGLRDGIGVFHAGNQGNYWLSSLYEWGYSYSVGLNSTCCGGGFAVGSHYGFAVRLVHDAE